MEAFLKCFIPLFVAIDAPGNLPLFLGLTERLTKSQRIRVARQASITAFVVAVLFVFAGKMVLSFLHVTPADFKIAGGSVLFILAVRWVLPHSIEPEETQQQVAAVPLGVPVFVGPAALTTLLMQVDTFAVWWVMTSLVANIVVMWLTCHYGTYIARWMGVSGMRAFAKVVNLLLAALGVMMVRRGLEEILSR